MLEHIQIFIGIVGGDSQLLPEEGKPWMVKFVNITSFIDLIVGSVSTVRVTVS
jgi:hypothetical protein